MAANTIKENHMGLRGTIKEMIARRYFGEWHEVPFDNTGAWVGYAFQELMKDDLCRRKPMYAWGVLQGAALGKVLGMKKVSALEFGVAGGAGLLSLERIALKAAKMIDIGIDVYGFDTGIGLPKPEDHRDQPNMWFEGQLPMKPQTLKTLLTTASLRLGPVSQTVPAFLGEAAPVAFISFDLDLYSSTRDAFAVFRGSHECLLPRVLAYFDDILGHTYNDFAGERLAISEFNAENATAKLSPVYGLRFSVPQRFMNLPCWDCFYYAHFFQHPRYCVPDSYDKAVYTDEHGHDVRQPLASDWRAKLFGPDNSRSAR
jgi:hypothetical protein